MTPGGKSGSVYTGVLLAAVLVIGLAVCSAPEVYGAPGANAAPEANSAPGANSVPGSGMNRAQLQHMAATLRSWLKTNREDASARFQLARILTRLGKPRDALVEYDRLLAQDPGNPEYIREKAETMYASGRKGQALLLLKKIRMHGASYEDVYQRHKRMYEETESSPVPPDEDAGTQDADSRRPLTPDHGTPPARQTAAVETPLSPWPSRQLAAPVRRSEDDYETLMKRAAAAERERKYSRAQYLYKKALSRSPGEVKPLWEITRIRYQLGNYTEAVKSARSLLVRDPHRPDVLLLLGRILGLQEKYRESADTYHRVLELEPGSIEARTALAQVTHKITGDPYQVPAMDQLRNKRTGTLQEAGKLMAARRYEAARQLYQSLYKKNDHDLQAITGLANAHRGLGDGARAEEFYRLAESLKPGLFPVKQGRLWLLVSQSDYHGAIVMAQRLLADNPGVLDVLKALATSHRALQQYEETLAAYEHILEQEPGNTAVLFDAAVLCNYTNRNQQALRYLERLHDIQPHRADVKAMLFQLGTWYARTEAELVNERKRLALDQSDIDRFNELERPAEWNDTLRETSKQYAEAVGVDASSPESLVGLGTVMIEDGRLVEADRLFRLALESSPDNVKAAEGMERVRLARLPEADISYRNTRRKDYNPARKRFDRKIYESDMTGRIDFRLPSGYDLQARFLRTDRRQVYYPESWTEYHIKGNVLSLGLHHKDINRWRVWVRGDLGAYRSDGDHRYDFPGTENGVSGLAVVQREYKHQQFSLGAGRKADTRPRLGTDKLDIESVDWVSAAYDCDTARYFSLLGAAKYSSAAMVTDPQSIYTLRARYRLPKRNNIRFEYEVKMCRSPDVRKMRWYASIRDKLGDRLRYWINYSYLFDSYEGSDVDTHGVDFYVDTRLHDKLYWYIDCSYYYERDDNEDRSTFVQTGFKLKL